MREENFSSQPCSFIKVKNVTVKNLQVHYIITYFDISDSKYLVAVYKKSEIQLGLGEGQLQSASERGL